MVRSDGARRSLRSRRKLRSRIRAAIVALRLHDTAIREYSRTSLTTFFSKVADDSKDKMNVDNPESEMKYCCVTN
jgi:hypothetical protein